MTDAVPPDGQSPAHPGQPDPVPPSPADEPDPQLPPSPGHDQPGQQPYGQPGPANPQPFTPPGYSQPDPANPQPFTPPGYGEPSAFPYGQPGPTSPRPSPPGYGQPSAQPGAQPYGRPGPTSPPSFPPPPPGYGQPWYGQPGSAGPEPFAPPPPGYGQPRYGQPGYGQPGYRSWNMAPAPGGVPLRPLGLGDIFNGAVTLARRNPAATFGLTAIVMSVYGVAAAIAEHLYTTRFANFVQTFQPGQQQPTQQQVNDFVSSLVGVVLPVVLGLTVLSLFVYAVLTGLLGGVTGRGILGHKVSLSQAWRAGRVGAVVGTSAMLFLLLGVVVPLPVVVVVVVLALLHLTPAAVLVGVLGGLGTAAFEILLLIRLSLTLPAVVLERVSPAAAVRRSWQLSHRSFWRLLGILLLTVVVVVAATYVLTIPFFVIEALISGSGGPLTASSSTSVAALVVSIVGFIVTATVTMPFAAGVLVLLYADLRMRREGLDLTLREAALSQALTGGEFSAVWQPPESAQPTAW